MFTTGQTTCQISTPIPSYTSQDEVISLLHNHGRHMDLDAHLESKTLLSRQTLPLMARKPHKKQSSEQQDDDLLSDWLYNETRRYVANVSVGPRRGGDVEFWSVEIAHPMGRMFGRLRYVICQDLPGCKSFESLEIKRSVNEIRYSAAFINTMDGVVVIVEVPGGFGMRSWTKYSVCSSSLGQGWQLMEDIKLQCPLGFGGFTKKEIEKSHPEAHRKIIDDVSKGKQQY